MAEGGCAEGSIVSFRPLKNGVWLTKPSLPVSDIIDRLIR